MEDPDVARGTSGCGEGTVAADSATVSNGAPTGSVDGAKAGSPPSITGGVSDGSTSGRSP